jgi:antitoxin (DNA-binding transcriptional repressor) of toxin-antitoxin stability system
VKDRDGVRLPFAADLTSQVYGGGINVVTKTRLFGGFYGFQVVFPLHLKTGEWVRHAASRGAIVVTDRGRRVAALQPFDASVTGRPLPNREATIRKRSKVPVDSAVYVSELREDR